MSVNRAQVSLSFEDEELYEGLIVPLKKTKTLQKTILDCLTAFYYNDTVRQIVSGIEEEIYLEEEVEDKDAIFADIRNSLLASEFIMDECAATIEDGMADISTIVEAVASHVKNRNQEEEEVSKEVALLEQKEVPVETVATGVSKGMPSVSATTSDDKLNLLISMMTTMMEKGHFVREEQNTPEVEIKEPKMEEDAIEVEEQESAAEEESGLEETTQEIISEPVVVLEPQHEVVEEVIPEVEVVQEPTPIPTPTKVEIPHVATVKPPITPTVPITPPTPTPVEVTPIPTTTSSASIFDDDDDDFDNWDINDELATVDLSEEPEDIDYSDEMQALLNSAN